MTSSRPMSLARRLSLAAAVSITVAILLASIALGFVLHRFILGQIDGRLDSQITFLRSLIRVADDGTLTLSGDADGPPFDRPHGGWYWQVAGPMNALRSRALGDADLMQGVTVPPPPPHAAPDHAERPRPADQIGVTGQHLHYRIIAIETTSGTVRFVATSPRDAASAPLREALVTLAIALAVLALALVSATFVQVKIGLRPLAKLRADLLAIRGGARERLPVEQPTEIRSLVHDLNDLLMDNAETLARARRHVANLAHGLKTPLSTLAVLLANYPSSTSSDAQALVDEMERRIRHHLTRARSAATTGPGQGRVPLLERVTDIAASLAKIYATKNVVVRLEIAPDMCVTCDATDFDEILGNVLDNAFKWARSRVYVEANVCARQIRITVSDDGPGIGEEPHVPKPGKRLDETVPGSGFGLVIVRELAELYSGDLTLSPASSGGLEASVTLPSSVSTDVLAT